MCSAERSFQNSIVDFMTSRKPELNELGGREYYIKLDSSEFSNNLDVRVTLEYIRLSDFSTYKDIIGTYFSEILELLNKCSGIQVTERLSQQELSKLDNDYRTEKDNLLKKANEFKQANILELKRSAALEKRSIVDKLFNRKRRLDSTELDMIEKVAQDKADKFLETSLKRLDSAYNKKYRSRDKRVKPDDALKNYTLTELALKLTENKDILATGLDKLSKDLSDVIGRKGLIESLSSGVMLQNIPNPVRLYGRESLAMNSASKDRRGMYTENIFGITPEYYYTNLRIETGRIDLVISLNGIPIVALELKATMSGQDVNDAVKQFKSRSGYCFNLNTRFVLYIAMDESHAMASTDKINWIPFNQGENPKFTGTEHIYKYLLRPCNLINILDIFVTHIQNEREDYLLFPRFHQFEAVESVSSDLITKQREGKPQQNYLIYHSAGSGKTFSILWLALRLSALYTGNIKVFSKIIIVSDRKQINQQISNASRQLNIPDGVIAAIDNGKNSSDLDRAIGSYCQIIITTIQKFGYIKRKLDESNLAGRYGVIIDEAHSSQGGEFTRSLYRVLVEGQLDDQSTSLEQEDCTDDCDIDSESFLTLLSDKVETTAISDTMVNQLKNKLDDSLLNNELQMFAFTATPVDKTYRLFGTLVDAKRNKYTSFHDYTMGQAIYEGYILNVVRNYTIDKCNSWVYINSGGSNTYNQTGLVTKKIVDKLLLNPEEIEYKANQILNHFMKYGFSSLGYNYTYTDEAGVTKTKLVYTGKAMIVAGSRKEAYLLYRTLNRIISDRAQTDTRYLEFKTLISFTGKLNICDLDNRLDIKRHSNSPSEVTSANILAMDYGINHGENPDVIKSIFHRYEYAPDHNNCDYRFAYRILVVANQFQTGFDEPYLNIMYVCKVLRGVSIIQTLSRLNRCNKYVNKQEVYIYDFCNEPKEIEREFKSYIGKRYFDDIRIMVNDLPSMIDKLIDMMVDNGLVTRIAIDEYIQADPSEYEKIELRISQGVHSENLAKSEFERMKMQLVRVKDTCNRLDNLVMANGLPVSKLSNDSTKAKIDILDKIIKKLAIELRSYSSENVDDLDITIKRGVNIVEQAKIDFGNLAKPDSSTVIGSSVTRDSVEKHPRSLEEIVKSINSTYNRCVKNYTQEYIGVYNIELPESLIKFMSDTVDNLMSDKSLVFELRKLSQRVGDIDLALATGSGLENFQNETGLRGKYATKIYNKLSLIRAKAILVNGKYESLSSEKHSDVLSRVCTLLQTIFLRELYIEASER